jgi:SNF2 family DNA or RNA helicase
VGITLTSGSHIIFMEPILDDSIKKQAIGRLARTGQLNDVFIHNVITEKSMDKKIIEFGERYDAMIKEMKKENAGNQLTRVEKNYTTAELYKMLL